MPESGASRRTPSDALSTAIEAARESPDNTAHWELVEELVDTAQRPSDVRELFREVLQAPKLPAEVASDVGQRAVRFYEAWYGEDSSELAELLAAPVAGNKAAPKRKVASKVASAGVRVIKILSGAGTPAQSKDLARNRDEV